jgi:hypothetical protein
MRPIVAKDPRSPVIRISLEPAVHIVRSGGSLGRVFHEDEGEAAITIKGDALDLVTRLYGLCENWG